MKLFIFVSLLIFVSTVFSSQSQYGCYNPNRRPGDCKSIFACPNLLNVITDQPISEDDQRFLVESQCEDGAGKPPYVCCTKDVGFLSGSITDTILASSNGQGDIIPSPPACGSPESDNEISPESTINREAFPWLALLAYVTDDSETSINCGGTLINSRYVLTAAHCVKGGVENDIGPLFAVQLGVYNLTSKDSKCTESDGENDIFQVGIEEVIPHELYDSNSTNHHHDIALIRLSRDIVYTESIRPICLPATLSFDRSAAKTELTIAGWGFSLQVNQSDIKQQLTIPVLEQQECYDMLECENVTIIDSQICAGGRVSDDNCRGDSGGPLMSFVHNYWVIEGVYSFNNFCGANRLWPGTYTRVSGYGNWIRRHMRP